MSEPNGTDTTPPTQQLTALDCVVDDGPARQEAVIWARERHEEDYSVAEIAAALVASGWSAVDAEKLAATASQPWRLTPTREEVVRSYNQRHQQRSGWRLVLRCLSLLRYFG